jgi:hypothetical protein
VADEITAPDDQLEHRQPLAMGFFRNRHYQVRRNLADRIVFIGDGDFPGSSHGRAARISSSWAHKT